MEQGKAGASLIHAMDAIEGLEGLDGIGDAIGGVVHQATSADSVKNALSGAALGHALHPVLTDLPIGFWTSAVLVDLFGGDGDAEDLLLAAGNISALAAAASGLADWSDTIAQPRRAGLVHAALNMGALGLFSGALIARRRGGRAMGRTLLVAGSAVATVSQYIGGHLVYRRGLGVSRAGFENEEAIGEWQDAAAEADVQDDSPVRVDVNGVPVMLVRNDGELRALVAACNHAGGPLDEGEISNGAVTCPWHGSRFSLSDGSVERGPAAQPQPVLATRVRKGRIEVRAG